MTQLDTISEDRRRLLEKFRRGELQASSGALDPLIPRPSAAQFPLPPGLEQVWLQDQSSGGAPVNNESYTIHKRGPLDPAVLERCFNEVARRHEIWRSAFSISAGKIVQRIDPNVRVPLPFVDLSHLSEAERDQQAIRIATEDSRRPFDLNTAPLFRVCLVRCSENYHRVYLTAHRLVFDCASIDRVLMSELAALYSAYSSGRPSPLPEPVFQYRDYAAWMERRSASGSHAAQLEYWRQCLSENPLPFDLAAGRPRPPKPTWRCAMETCTIPGPLIEALKELASSEGVTPYMVLLAAFQVLLYRFSGQDEIIIGGKTNTRTRPEFEPLIGSFVNSVVFRNHIAAGISFQEYLGHVKSNVLGALAHSEIPFDDIVQELAPKHDSGAHPMFQVLFSMRAHFSDFRDGWDLTDMEVHSGASSFDLFAEFAELSQGMAVRFVYSTDLFDRPTILSLQENFQALLRELISNPLQTVSGVALFTDQNGDTGGNIEFGKEKRDAAPSPVLRKSASQNQYTAPRDSTERQLVAIWETLLAKHPIGVEDNFFQLGGRSMSVAQMILQVERTFGESLSMATVFLRPTIAQLAGLLREEKTWFESCRVFPIQPQGTQPPFICLGAGPFFLPLAHCLGTDQPTHGVDMSQLETEKLSASVRLQDIAAHVVAAIREFQPRGPYYLGGFCMYGVLIYEVAQQIVAGGGEVAVVIMIDSPILAQNAKLNFFTRMQIGLQKWAYHASLLAKLRPADIPPYLSRCVYILRARAKTFWQRTENVPAVENANGRSDIDVDSLVVTACGRYEPQPYSGPVALFQAAERPSGRHWDLREVWLHLMRGPFQSHRIVGGHAGMFQEPYVGALAKAMKDSLHWGQKLHRSQDSCCDSSGK